MIDRNTARDIFTKSWTSSASIIEIAESFGVSAPAVSCIKNRMRHKISTKDLTHLMTTTVRSLHGEEWKEIPCWPEHQVSNLGRVKRTSGGWCGRAERLRTIHKHHSGYAVIILVEGRRKQTFSPHRLVALAFMEPDPVRKHVNHIDGNRMNNRLDNLEWCTPQENVLHSIKFGNRKRKKSA